MKRLFLAIFILLTIGIARVAACDTSGECSYNVAQKVYFYIVDSDGITPEPGVSYTAVTIGFTKDDNTIGTISLAADDCATLTDGDWCEIDATNQPGLYYAYEGTTATFNGIGNFIVVYSAAGHKTQAYGFVINAEDRLATTDFDSTATVATAAVDEWETQSQAAPTGFQVNTKLISDNATPADNIELMYDGTGYTATSAPASRSQVDGISGGSGGSINREPSYDNTTTDNINSGGAAIDKGDGTVGIPVTGHAFVANLQVTIANTVNYNGSFTLVSQTTNEVVITSSFTSETFGADDTIISTIKTIPFVGTVTSGTFASVATEDGVVHDLADDTDIIDIAYGFAIGGGRSASAVTVVANVNGNTDEILIKAYDFVGTAWDTVGVIDGSGGSSFIEVDPKLLLRHTGTGSDLGNVFIRLDTDTTTPSQLEVDLLLVSAVSIGQSVGYANGQLWLDTVNGILGSEPFVNCVADSPCKTLANVKTLSGTVGISDFHIINGSSITLAESTVNESYFGDNWTLALGGQDVADAYFQGPHVSGVGVSATEVHYEGCDVSTMSVQIGHFDYCSFSGTVTHTLAGDYNYHNSYSKIPGVGSPIFTKTAGQTITAQWRGWSGSITVSTIEAGDVMTISGTELGDIVLNGVDGTVKILGEYESLTDNRTGSPVRVLGAFNGSDIADILGDTGTDGVLVASAEKDDIVDRNWDEVNTGATHNDTNSTGRQLREVREIGVYEKASIWYDSNGSAGATDYENGTVDNPVNNMADLNTLAASLGINRFEVAIGSSITFAAAQTDQLFMGQGWTLALGGQDVSDSHIFGATISGIGVGATSVMLHDCIINTATLNQAHIINCGFSATLTFGLAGDYVIHDGYSIVAGSGTPIIDVGAAIGNVNLSIPNWMNGIEIRNINNTGVDEFSISGVGQIIYAASSSGSVQQRGDWKVTNTGGVTITADDNTTNNADILVDTGTTLPATLGTPSDFGSGTSTLAANLEDMADDGTAVYDRSTDSSQAIRDRGDAAWVTGAGGDPWTTALPGAYGAGTAGKIIGDNIDSPISIAQTDLDIITDSDGVILGAAGVDLVWDEVLSMMDHNVGQSGAKLLRLIANLIQIDGTVSDVSPATTGFDTNLTQANTYFDDALMIFTNGSANAGIGKHIATHVNASGHVTFTADLAWPVTPINGDDFVIVATHSHPITEIQAGLATEAKQDIIDTNVDDIKSDTGTDGVVVAAGSKTGYALSTAGVDAILDDTVDGTLTLREVLCAMSATQFGKSSGMGTTTITMRNVDDDTDVAVATMDASYNRDAVVLTLTGCN